MSLLTGVYGHVGHHILHEKEKNRRRNTALEYYPKEGRFLLYFPLYVKHLDEYTKAPWPRGLIIESVTEDHVWGGLFYQEHRAKGKQGRILKAVETRIFTSNFDTKYCATLLRRFLAGGTTESVENRDRSQFLGYPQLNQYLCACLKLLKNQIYAGQSVISMEHIKSVRVCMLMKMVQSRRVKYDKSTYKENITSDITPYQLVGDIQGIEEALWYLNNKCKKYYLARLRDMMCFLMTKCGILCSKSLFWRELSDFG